MKLFDPTPAAMASLAAAVDEIPAIQARLVERDPKLKHGDRVAHQQQIAGGLAKLAVAARLPKLLEGVGLFIAGATYTGIGRISNGLGCPHLETDPDFLGIMLAFRVGGRRIDFLGINDATAPTDTVEQFVALLAATAEAAGAAVPFGTVGELDLGNLAAAQKKMFDALHERLGLRLATSIYAHVAKQTARTALSTSAYQQYWTGIVQVGDTLGKFTLLPAEDVNRHRDLVPAARHLTQDWRERQSRGDLRFALYWIPFLDDAVTPLEDLTTPWKEDHRVEVGVITFPRTRAETRQAKLLAILAAEMGANPGNWVAAKDSDAKGTGMPATRFTAGRFLAYRKSQAGRAALPESSYEAVFADGEITSELAAELILRYQANRASGHGSLNLGEVA